MLINFTIFQQKATHEITSFNEAVGLLKTGGIIYVSITLNAVGDEFELFVLRFVGGALVITHDAVF